jgi:hypothetical protein
VALEDILDPERNLMLVRRESAGEGEWHGIAIPASVKRTDHILGTIVKAGPAAPLPPGTRVVMSRGAGTAVALLEGGAEEMAIISGGDVLALLPGEEVAAA